MRKNTSASGWRAFAAKNCAMTGLASAARGLAGAFIARDAIACRSSFEARDVLGGNRDTGDVANHGEARETKACPAAPVPDRKDPHPDHLRAFRGGDARSAQRTQVQNALHPAGRGGAVGPGHGPVSYTHL